MELIPLPVCQYTGNLPVYTSIIIHRLYRMPIVRNTNYIKKMILNQSKGCNLTSILYIIKESYLYVNAVNKIILCSHDICIFNDETHLPTLVMNRFN